MTGNNYNEEEAAPLLANGSANGDTQNDSDLKSVSPFSQKLSIKQRLQCLGRWLRNNVKILSLVALLSGGVVAMVVFIGHTICLTPACVIAAAGILENMSPDHHSINPCEDFSKFVCGGWEQKHDLRPDQDSVSSGSVMYESSQQTLRHLLESPYSENAVAESAKKSADRVIFDKLQSAYDACMDEKTIQDRGSGPLLEILRKVGEYFPVDTDGEDRSSFSTLSNQHQQEVFNSEENPLTKAIAYLASIGVDALVAFGVDADEKNPDSVVLSMSALSRPGLPSKEYYQDRDVVKSYGNTIGQVLEGLLREAQPLSKSAVQDRTIFECNEDLVKAVVQLESDLAFASPAEEDAEDVTKYYNPRSLTEVRSIIPQLSLPCLLSTLAPSGFVPQKIIVGSPSYLEAVSRQLEKTAPETLRAYLVWKTVQAYVDEVEDDAVLPLKRFNKELQGKDPDSSEERWRTCVRATDRGLGWILSKFFVEEAFSKEAKAFGDQIIYDIKDQFVEKLRGAKWMSPEVRDVAVEKVHQIVQKIGYPTKSPDVLDPEAIEKYYHGVHITNATYFGNSLNIAKFKSHREWAKLGKPTNRDEWLMTAVTVNAYYNPPGNEIVFPAGIMQPPIFYDPSLPPYISYGPFGSISGHELTHAFDSNGRHYDQNGNYTDWWDNETVNAFKAKEQCFVDQYSNFTILDPQGKELHVNGRLTLGENIADAGGLSAAFHAWKKIEKKRPGQLLPGLQHFTKEQMFFITYPSLFCGKARKERAVFLIHKDAHSPSWARILGTVANSGEFKEAFNCPKKEPTCKIW
ncbi:MAG: hypothetical protein Q9208_002114 [Pyrenodesmia sp. 3 TL-2023]